MKDEKSLSLDDVTGDPPMFCNMDQLRTGRPAPWLEVEHLLGICGSSRESRPLATSSNVPLHFIHKICKAMDQVLEGGSAERVLIPTL